MTLAARIDPARTAALCLEALAGSAVAFRLVATLSAMPAVLGLTLLALLAWQVADAMEAAGLVDGVPEASAEDRRFQRRLGAVATDAAVVAAWQLAQVADAFAPVGTVLCAASLARAVPPP